jgi:hypothetical protein
MNDYSFPRYLAAKKTVDDRALNRTVWDALVYELPTGLLRILEIGAGIGTMIEHLLDWGLLRDVNYTALDGVPTNIAAAQERLLTRGFSLTPQGLEFKGVAVSLEVGDLFDFLPRQHQKWDLIIAHAFMDVVDIPATLPSLLECLNPGGLAYFTINFDGVTSLEPTVDPELDEIIPMLYHQTMDVRRTPGKPSGDSRSGRHLFTHLKAAGAKVLAAGGSDWVVFPGPDGYPGDEGYFLHFMIQTISSALEKHPVLAGERFVAWVQACHDQVERGELIYIAHQMDFLAKIA